MGLVYEYYPSEYNTTDQGIQAEQVGKEGCEGMRDYEEVVRLMNLYFFGNMSWFSSWSPSHIPTHLPPNQSVPWSWLVEPQRNLPKWGRLFGVR